MKVNTFWFLTQGCVNKKTDFTYKNINRVFMLPSCWNTCSVSKRVFDTYFRSFKNTKLTINKRKAEIADNFK